MFLMIFVFLLEIIFAFLPSYVGEITTLIAQLVLTVSHGEITSRNEITNLKDEQAQLSITDEFVRYAKLQRQIDKLMLDIKEKGSERKRQIYYLRLGITVVIYLLHGVFIMSLLYLYRETSLLNINSSWVAPLGKIVAFPSGNPGTVGLGCWFLVSNSVIHRMKTLAKL